MRLTAAAVVVALAAAGCGGDDSKPLIAASKTAVVRGELIPDVHLFGEPVVAQVDVIVNREKTDPADVRLRTNFDPYEEVGETRSTRQDIGEFTYLRYTTTLRCLGIDCIPRTLKGNASTVSQLPGDPVFLVGQQRDEKRSYAFPAAIVLSGRGADAETLGRVVWAPLRSLSRINWYDSSVVGQGFPFVGTVAPLQQPDYRISPTLTRARSLHARARCSSRCRSGSSGAGVGGAPVRRPSTPRRSAGSSVPFGSSSGRAAARPSTSGARHSRRSPSRSMPRTGGRPRAPGSRGGRRRPRSRSR